MSTRHCPDCYKPVQVAPSAREGRCTACRPRHQRVHSQPRRDPTPEYLTTQ